MSFSTSRARPQARAISTAPAAGNRLAAISAIIGMAAAAGLLGALSAAADRPAEGMAISQSYF